MSSVLPAALAPAPEAWWPVGPGGDAPKLLPFFSSRLRLTAKSPTAPRSTAPATEPTITAQSGTEEEPPTESSTVAGAGGGATEGVGVGEHAQVMESVASATGMSEPVPSKSPAYINVDKETRGRRRDKTGENQAANVSGYAYTYVQR